MMSRRTVKAIVIVIVVAMLVTTLFSFVFFLPSVHGAERAITAQERQYLTERLREFERYLEYIHQNFKNEVDLSTLMNGAFEGAINSLGDPYSVFFSTPEAGQDYIERATGEFDGVGVVMRMNPDGFCEITEVIMRSPAERAGVRPGDIIVRVNGQDVTEKSLQEISNMLRGNAGTSVTIVVKRAGIERTFTMTRERISRASLDYEMLEGNIGYILLKQFDTDGVREFRNAKTSLMRDGAQSLILDMRNNSGGLIDTAIAIANEYISDGDIVHFKRRGEVLETISATSRAAEQLETVILINEYSASASEILAGALQDHNAATLVGMTTFGKGIAQILTHTNDRRPYTLSIYYFLTPDKNVIHNAGITPDHVVRNSLGELREEALARYRTFAPFAENARAQAGDTGLNVFAAQQRLALLGYELDITAAMDGATVEAIRLFQQEQGLFAYGVLDFTTMRRIQEVTTSFINNDSREDLQLKKAIELLQ